MKRTKKLMALVVAMVMMVAMGTVVFAQTEGTAAAGKGSITIENASKGETYSVVKIFGATLTGDATATTDASGIAYTGTIPEDLQDYFEYDAVGNIIKKAGVEDAALIAAVQEYAKSLDATAEVVSDGSILTFQGLDYGYYAVISTQGATVTIDSLKPNATVYDKNSKVITVGKRAGDATYSIGDTVTYTATFDTVNYIGEGASAQQVTKYVISDTLPEFLDDVVITSLKVKSADGTEELADLGYTTFGDNKKVRVYWAEVTGTDDDNNEIWKSLYPNGAKIVLTYTGTLTDITNVNAPDINTVSIQPYVVDKNHSEQGDDDDDDDGDDDDDDDDMPYSEPYTASEDITTYAAALKKIDGEDDSLLAGAKFKFYGLTVEETADGIYTVVSYNPTSTTLGTEMTVAPSGDDKGKLYIIGLGSDVTLTGVETEAPAGYNKLDGEVTLTPQVLSETKIIKESGTIYYDAQGNVSSVVVTDGGSTVTETKNLNELDENALEVQNNKGTELPSTGGIGTTIFYIIGGIIVLGAVILLVVRSKRNKSTN